jgi:hypothetical protein
VTNEGAAETRRQGDKARRREGDKAARRLGYAIQRSRTVLASKIHQWPSHHFETSEYVADTAFVTTRRHHSTSNRAGFRDGLEHRSAEVVDGGLPEQKISVYWAFARGTASIEDGLMISMGSARIRSAERDRARTVGIGARARNVPRRESGVEDRFAFLWYCIYSVWL